MPIGQSDIEHIAQLARLGLTPAEVERMQADLAKILDYVGELAAVDTSGVPAAVARAERGAPLRDDQVEPGVARDTALEQAPRHSDSGFAVPAFVEE